MNDAANHRGAASRVHGGSPCRHRFVPGGAGWGWTGGRGGGAPQGDPAAAPTPRLASGKPDLTGSWGGGGWNLTGSGAPGATVGDMFRRCTPFQSKTCMEWTNQSQDWVFMSTSRLDMRVPIYKPEHWDKMIEMDQWTNRDDPVMTCLPLGIPRQGPPARIFHTDTDITMIYRGGVDGAGGYAEFRMVAIDGKPHDPAAARTSTPTWGTRSASGKATRSSSTRSDSTDETWLARGGYFHSDQMRVVEKFTRTGNQIALRRDRRGSGSAASSRGSCRRGGWSSARPIRSSPSAEAARKASRRKSPRRCGTEATCSSGLTRLRSRSLAEGVAFGLVRSRPC